MNAIIYTRVSTTDKQEVSLDLQLEKCRLACKLNNYTIVGEYEDRESGKSFNRPELKKILAMIESRQIEVLVIYKLDRLSRNVSDMSQLVSMMNKKNVQLVSISEQIDTSSISGRLFLNILCSMAEFERESIANRITESLQHRKNQGKKYTRITPYGKLLRGRKYVNCHNEQKTLQEIIRLKSNHTFKEVADLLNKAGNRTKQGKEWSLWTVKHIFYKYGGANA